jgi:hypothetical protein
VQFVLLQHYSTTWGARTHVNEEAKLVKGKLLVLRQHVIA